ncbi:MAG: polysaccharide biosynthesis tyrosine autokinase [Nitrospinota bacterium]|nr:polysaccharide biosynthesis tyrosine autokinase [Nitrospinota bacterium]
MSDKSKMLNPGKYPDYWLDNQEEHEGLFFIWWAAKAHKRLVFWICFGAIFICALVVMQLTPLYTSGSLVFLESRGVKVVDLESAMEKNYGDRYKVQSEIEMIRSPELARRVINKLGLGKLPEFLPAAKKTSVVYNILNFILPTDWSEALTDSIWGGQSPVYDEQVLGSKVLEKYLKRLNVSGIRESLVIRISFTSADPKLAALVANTMASEYTAMQVELKLEEAKKANYWLRDRLVELKNKLEASEKAIGEFLRDNTLFESGGKTIDSQQMSELNSQLIIAKSQYAQANAKYQHLKRLYERGDTSKMVGAEEVLSSPVIQKLRMQEADLANKISELSQDYGEKHPVMINTKAQYQDIKREINEEIGNILKSLDNNVDVARVKVNSLQSELARVVAETGAETGAKIRLMALEREANANRTLYEQFLGRFKETNEGRNLEQPESRIVARGEIPIHPSFPKKPAIFAGALFFALLLGVMASFFIERRNITHGFMNQEQIKSILGVKVLGAVPELESLDILDISPEECVMSQPYSPYSEAIRSISMSLYINSAERSEKTYLFTSSLPEEGKTALSISLARSCAMDSHKVLHIDFDLRKPKVQSRIGAKTKYGILDVLDNRCKINEAIIKDKSGAHFMTSGARRQSKPTSLKVEQIKKMLDNLAKYYDLILLDSAPVLPVGDSRSLVKCVDSVIYLAKWKETKREAVQSGVQILLDHNAKIHGLVLTSLDVRENSRYYGYKSSYYYYGDAYTHSYS